MSEAAKTETPQVLLAHHLRKLKLPTFLREYDRRLPRVMTCSSVARTGMCQRAHRKSR